jgi:hypothetical protein
LCGPKPAPGFAAEGLAGLFGIAQPGLGAILAPDVAFIRCREFSPCHSDQIATTFRWAWVKRALRERSDISTFLNELPSATISPGVLAARILWTSVMSW